MNEAKDSGGPVFPVQNGLHNGMHLRDYFAAKALGGLINYSPESDEHKMIAELCYALADAMLEARK